MKTSHLPIRETDNRCLFLQRLRSYGRRAWFLHGWLVASIILLPFRHFAIGDEGDPTCAYEVLVQVKLSAVGGTSGMEYGESRQVNIVVEKTTTEKWTGADGSTWDGATTVSSIPASLACAVYGGGASGPSVTPAGLETSSGEATVSFNIGDSAAALEITATYADPVNGVGNASATSALNFDQPHAPKTWSYDHTETVYWATLSTTGVTQDAPVGSQKPVKVHVTYHSEDIYKSNYDEYEGRNPGDGVVSGASLSWTIQGNGDVGGLDYTSSSTDGSGNDTRIYTVGSAPAVVGVNVSFGMTNATDASISFTPEEVWSVDHPADPSYSLNFTADGSTDGLAPSATRTLTATVMRTDADVMTSNRGGTKTVTYDPVPASGETVTFAITHGDGTVAGTSSTTASADSEGHAAVTFTMGSDSSGVSAGLGAEGSIAGSTLEFSPFVEVWAHDHFETTYETVLEANDQVDDVWPQANRTLTATVTATIWDVWKSNAGNSTPYFDHSDPVSGATVTFSGRLGGGSIIDSQTATTGGNGRASVAFEMGGADAEISATPQLSGAPLGVGASFNLWAHVEQWTQSNDETTIYTWMSANAKTTELPAGTERTLTANVSFISWQVWTSDMDHKSYVNPSSGAAQGATVSFSTNTGSLSNTDPITTDANGRATVTFTMGGQNARVIADASFAAASSAGSIDLTSDPWVWHHDDSKLTMALSLNAAGTQVIADVSYTTWQVLTNGTTFRNRNYSVSPAGNTVVSLTPEYGNCVVTPMAPSTTVDGTSVPLTNIDGRARASLEVQASFDTIHATATFLGVTAAASLDVTGPCNCSNGSCPQTTSCTCGGQGTCNYVSSCSCGAQTCSHTSCDCGGTGSCDSTAAICNGCDNGNCPGSDCSCGGAGDCAQLQTCGSSECTCGSNCAGPGACIREQQSCDCSGVGNGCSCSGSASATCHPPNQPFRPCGTTSCQDTGGNCQEPY